MMSATYRERGGERERKRAEREGREMREAEI
jgi:hypothetical protein